MPSNARSIYWDACVFLSYINGIPARLPTIDNLLKDSADPDSPLEIITSVLSIAEVAWAQIEKDKKALDQAAEQRIKDLWNDRAAIRLAEFHELVALDAAALMRGAIVKGWSLKAPDAIHLATAQRIGVLEFHTYDDKLDKYDSDVGIKICRPNTLYVKTAAARQNP
ncbi:MAG: type II toxin-antitoxin system VapC family toxin [Dehalococcoidia bacterium]